MARNTHEEVDEESPLLRHQSRSKGTTPEHSPARNVVAPDTPIRDEPSNKKLALILGSVWVGVFFAAVDATMMATLSAPIATTFNSFSILSWTATAYLIANAAVQPLTGRLTDIYGRRAGILFSNAFFAAGNLICGLAARGWIMILGRVTAGIGGGGLFAIQTIVASDLVPLRRRGLWQGIGNLVFGTGSAMGGFAAGWINEVWGWRASFLVQVPFILLSGILVYFTVKIPVNASSKQRLKRVDFLGAFTLITTLVTLLFGLNSGGNIVPWTHPLVLTTLPLSVIGACIFVYVEDQIAPEPIIPVRLLLHRTVAAACFTTWFTMMSMYSVFFYAPIYFQVLGLSTAESGTRLIPQGIGGALGALLTGIIMKRTGKYFVLNICLWGIYLLSCALLCTLQLQTLWWPPFIYLFLFGIGWGGTSVTALLALIAAVNHSEQALATSASYVFRSTGCTLGITIASAVFQNTFRSQLWDRFGGFDDATSEIGKIVADFDEINHLPPGWYDGVRSSYITALTAVFITNLGLAVLAAISSLFMREHQLHSTLARTAVTEPSLT